MAFIEHYATIKAIHLTAVAASGALFAARGALVLAGAKAAMAAPVRFLSYAIDTVLLGAAVTLVVILHSYPFVQPWLTAKVVLLPLYIVLGSYALKRARTTRGRALCYAAALAVFALIATIGYTHNVLGVLAR